MAATDPRWRPPADAWTRRDALRNGFGSFVALAGLGSLPRQAGSNTVTSAAVRARARSPFTPFRRDLPLPATLVPTRRTRHADIYERTVTEGLTEILPGFQTPIYGYDGVYPGATIRARSGRTVIVDQHNGLGFHTNVHLHGGHQPPRFDGHPMDLIDPGATFRYRYPNDQAGATLWYHDHAHGILHKTIYYGLAGLYLLEDDLERGLDLPRDEYEVPLLIQDRAFNRDGSLRYEENIDAGFLGDTILVNGAVAPRMRVKRRLYRLRLLNGSNARHYELRFGRGHRVHQIGGDGGLLERPITRRTLSLSAGERLDVLVDFSDFKPGTQVILRNIAGEGSTVAVMRFDVERGGGRDPARIPRRMAHFDPVPAPQAQRNWVLTFEPSARQWQINGKVWDATRVDCRPRLGTSELWQWINRSHMMHPMHIHGCQFRVVARSGSKLLRGDHGWKDIVRVDAGERVTVQPYITSHTGLYVFHCHMLEHSSIAGMMLQMEVTS
jgi:spore coat protein A